MKNKNFNLFNLFSKTFKNRKMFSFIGYGELKLMPKVSKPIRQTEETEETLELPEDYFNSLTKERK